MRNIHDAHAGFLAFMRQIKNTPSISPLLDGQSLAAIAVAIEIVVTHQRHVVRFRARLRLHLNSQRQNYETGKRANQQPTQCAPRSYPHTPRKATGWRP